jgi:hypothetical protein
VFIGGRERERGREREGKKERVRERDREREGLQCQAVKCIMECNSTKNDFRHLFLLLSLFLFF